MAACSFCFGFERIVFPDHAWNGVDDPVEGGDRFPAICLSCFCAEGNRTAFVEVLESGGAARRPLIRSFEEYVAEKMAEERAKAPAPQGVDAFFSAGIEEKVTSPPDAAGPSDRGARPAKRMRIDDIGGDDDDALFNALLHPY